MRLRLGGAGGDDFVLRLMAGDGGLLLLDADGDRSVRDVSIAANRWHARVDVLVIDFEKDQAGR